MHTVQVNSTIFLLLIVPTLCLYGSWVCIIIGCIKIGDCMYVHLATKYYYMLCGCIPIYCSHYFVHGGWFDEDGQLLNKVKSIRKIPATIVQGRYDIATPMKTAWELHKVHTYFSRVAIDMNYKMEGGGLVGSKKFHTCQRKSCVFVSSMH